jgi:hypothetical protein
MNEKPLKILESLLGMNRSRSKRSTELMKNPEERFTQWYMCIPKCFNDALDIKLTTRVENAVEKLMWTQGTSFSFKIGDVLYDTPEGYTHLWTEALQTIKMAVQIIQIENLVMSNQVISKSDIIFDIHVPNETKTGLIVKAQHRTSADNFVKFLIIGPDALKSTVDPA